MAIAIVNGIFSPWVLVLFVLYPVWYPSWAPSTSQFVYMASALVLSTLTLMVAGVPAALYERLSSRPHSIVVASIWLGCAAPLTLPALPNIMQALGGGWTLIKLRFSPSAGCVDPQTAAAANLDGVVNAAWW